MNHKHLLLYLVMLMYPLFAVAQEPILVILGTAQDGGYPQVACKKNCCTKVWKQPARKQFVSCLALVDPKSNKVWLFDATPDFREQWQLLKEKTNDSIQLAGIFLTHAHIGHYTGLMLLGREVMGAKQIPVYAMPRMKTFLETNGPWSQLVKLGNISIVALSQKEEHHLFDGVSVIPYLVPHRDEYSETVGFVMKVNSEKILFLPDIDKWDKWSENAVSFISGMDMAFIDATFYDENELPGRTMKEVPHPLVKESISLFQALKQNIYFIHMNHTNPLLQAETEIHQQVIRQGFHIAIQGELIKLK